jgi:hypothetical protein
VCDAEVQEVVGDEKALGWAVYRACSMGVIFDAICQKRVHVGRLEDRADT